MGRLRVKTSQPMASEMGAPASFLRSETSNLYNLGNRFPLTMNPQNHPAFTWSDAWLLQAIHFAAEGGGGSIKDVIAVGDRLNHAMFTYEELDGGLARLIGADLVCEDAGSFRPTDSAREMFAKIAKRHKGIHAQRGALRIHLGAPDWSANYDSGFVDPDWTLDTLSPEAVTQACAEYHREFQQAYRKMHKRGK